jgi:signal transduction histidine kinase
LIEDDDEHAAAFERHVRRSGLERATIVRASEVVDSKAVLEESPPDVIVLDLGLMETQGLETLRELLKQRVAAPVIVLTATNDAELGMAAIRAGAQDYVYKGDLSPGLLERSIRHALQRVELTAKVNAAHETLSNFVAVAAHDLSAPLRHIITFLELIERKLPPEAVEPVAHYFTHTTQAAERLRDLVSALLEFSTAGGVIGTRTETPFQKLVYDAVELLADEIEGTGAIVRSSGDASTPVHGNRELLARVLQNLVGNSIKFVDGHTPVIEVSHRAEGGGQRVSVTDNGIGIDEQDLSRIFEPLKRLHPASKYAGSGIGLATCRRIIEAHGGRIWAESRPGEGSTFHFSLPGADATSDQ